MEYDDCDDYDDYPEEYEGTDDEAPKLILWRGRQWVVTPDGLDCLHCLYEIDADHLDKTEGEANGHGTWPVHLSGKKWIDLEDFIEAWLKAMEIHDVYLDPKIVKAAIEFARLPNAGPD